MNLNIFAFSRQGLRNYSGVKRDCRSLATTAEKKLPQNTQITTDNFCANLCILWQFISFENLWQATNIGIRDRQI